MWLSKVRFWWFLVKGYFFWSISRFVNFWLFFKTKISFSKDQRTFFVEVRVFVEFDSWWSRCFLRYGSIFQSSKKLFFFVVVLFIDRIKPFIDPGSIFKDQDLGRTFSITTPFTFQRRTTFFKITILRIKSFFDFLTTTFFS